MATEYSRDVDDWGDCKWDHVGVDAMYDFYLKDKEAKSDAKDCDMDIEDFAREKSDDHYPMMLYCYPLISEPSTEEIVKVCRRTCVQLSETTKLTTITWRSLVVAWT